ncbi:MAG: hypothetical protein WC934_06265 [Acidithiobacillus sp.]|jgi:hypothetical protein
MNKPKYTCPICNKPCYKKDLFKQTYIMVINTTDNVKEERKYIRTTCFQCVSSEWITEDGHVLHKGKKVEINK